MKTNNNKTNKKHTQEYKQLNKTQNSRGKNN